MEKMKDYLTREGLKRDLDKTIEDALKFYRFIVRETPEQREAKQKVRLMEKIMGHIGFPKGVVHRLGKLESYCRKNGLDIIPINNELVSYCKENNIDFNPIESEDEDDVLVLTRLGKARYQLIYDKNGNYKGMSADFLVETGGNRLPM